MFPQLAAAYAPWRDGDTGPLHAAAAAGRSHWQNCCELALGLHRDLGNDAQARIEALIGAQHIRL